ncbi:MAG TPA: hypothetical protein VKE98_17760 [Gemmataceae bacterium]|nr:hypothetical protein [Gemmataceae bacterium]
MKQGKIVVAVDLRGYDDPARLALADRLLAEAGATEVHAVEGYP